MLKLAIVLVLAGVVSAKTVTQAEWNEAVDADICEWSARESGQTSYEWLRRVTITKRQSGWTAQLMIDAQRWQVDGIVTNMTRSGDVRFQRNGGPLGVPLLTGNVKIRPLYTAQSWLRFADQGAGGSLTGILGMTVNFWLELRTYGNPPYPSSSGTTYLDDALTANFDMDLSHFDKTLADELKTSILTNNKDKMFGTIESSVRAWLVPIFQNNMPRSVQLMRESIK